MNVSEAIFSRRSVRAYAPRAVEEATLRQLLRAAVQAPSAMNAQPWLFAVVQDAGQLKRYSDRAKALLLELWAGEPKALRYAELLRERSFNIFYTDADCWLAAQNLMLAACDAGLGTCCIGFALPVLNTPEVKAELGFPDAGAIVAALIVGYPSAIPDPVPRGPPQVAFWKR